MRRSVRDSFGSARLLVLRILVGGLMLILMIPSFGLTEGNTTRSDSDSLILEDFGQADEHGFPEGWEAQRSKASAKETYRIRKEKEVAYLEAKDANQRVYTKQISWNPKTHPVLTWRWRIRSVPEDAEFIAAVYPSLDVDLLFIPVNTKYVWSLTKKVGSVKEGGIFGSTEMVIRSGVETIGEWVEEKINVYEDFKQIHQYEPAQEAWGISLLGGPGVEIDFGALEVHPR